ncbi:GntR family transcriptional regulator [Anaerovoracaceae bacterium 41-7]|uniref:GntR family transcriptional regulator n=1 Tax=Emergencia sp. 1XD21-10 TaxID=2304569 RepID=UPI00137B1F3F|nr:GntR family transcriptional regulator [Emergencia sp. 1XD21-10]NCE99746.1 GntR family transcriptional regulator [Emergencia sp. 1XD21-10]
MFVDFKLDTAGQKPIYKQIAERISDAIKDGKLAAGFKLPTVRDLSGEIGVACGTIKHAYEYLEEQGFVEMVQGSGSFVIDQKEDFASRKEKAMIAIDQLFTRLESLGFTPREMEIYLDLKLRGLAEKYDVVKVALVDCNPETLQMIEGQLSQIGYAETAAFDLDRIEEAAESLNADYDLILTTSTHFTEVESYLRSNKPLAMVAMTPSVHTIVRLAKIGDTQKVGIFCASDAFAGVVRNNCQGLGSWSEGMATQLAGFFGKEEQFFAENDVVIVPEGYETFIASKEKQFLRSFCERGGELVSYSYKVDKGSFLHVVDQIKRVMNKKRSM